jgi:DNA-binding SARP family transcriptional activator/energy-coupling factor transporter ATP-binding protein EcfA2
MLTFGVLGPLAVWRNGDAVELLGLRQRTVLARLLAGRGSVVSVDALVDDLWGDQPPEQPTAAIQAFVSRLRRQLEPNRQPRATASVLATVPPGYVLRPRTEDVDGWRFEQLVRSAVAVMDTDPAATMRGLDEALALWRGTAYGEFADAGWARAEVTRLDELRAQAVELRADAGLRSGRAAEVVPALAAHVLQHPLRERAWTLLAAAQYATGAQGDALATLRQGRVTLAEELGLDPGPALRALEADILAQADHLVRLPAPRAAVPPDEPGPLFVGREAELARLLAMADRGGIVQIIGDAGAGKSTLLSRLAGRLTRRGWLVGRGSCAETGGVLPGWPWAEAVRALARLRPPPQATATGLGWLLLDDAPSDPDPVAGRHRTRRALLDYLTALTGEAPLLIALDDVHRADDETLALLTWICSALAGRPVLVVLTRRSAESTPRLDRAVAELARYQPDRLVLSGLGPDAVAAILTDTLSAEVDRETVAALTERTGGNPFFVRETAQLLAAVGPQAALSVVPDGVREVLGRRIGQLPTLARTVLTCAAVLGRDIRLDLLLELTGETEDVVLDAIDAALVVGLLTEPEPGRLAFPHALVRDAVYETASRIRRARLHVRAGTAIERHRPEDVTAIAYHYEAAGDPGLSDRTLRYARMAALKAERRYAFREAGRWWQVALDASELLGEPATARLPLLVSRVRAIASSGDLVAARALRQQTLRQVDGIDDPVVAASAIASFDVPTIWTSRPYGSVDVDVVKRTERVLRELPAGDSEPRCRMLINLALELEGENDERGFDAARQAEAMARRLGDPQALVMALNAQLLEHYWPGGHRERQRVGNALLQLSQEEHIVSAAVLGHMALAQTSAAQGDLDGADEHIRAVESLADTYEQPLTMAIASWYHGLRELVGGRLEPALEAYGRAARQMARLSMWQGEGDTVTATTACAWLSAGRMGELAASWDRDSTAARSYPEMYALALAQAGRRSEARQAAGDPRPIRRDYAFDLNWSIRGLLGVAIDDADRVADAYQALAPFADLLAGAGSAVLVIAPIGEILGDLAAHRGETALAADHYRHAVEVAQRAGAAHWAKRAGRAARRLVDAD